MLESVLDSDLILVLKMGLEWSLKVITIMKMWKFRECMWNHYHLFMYKKIRHNGSAIDCNKCAIGYILENCQKFITRV